MKVAYVILAHHRPAQLARMVRRLATAETGFYIHVGRQTSDNTYAAMREALAEVQAVRWLPRIPIRYAGFSIVQAMLIGLEEIARLDPLPRHTAFLSGQDYPLMPADAIERFFAERAGTSLVDHFALPSERLPGEHGGLDRVRYWHFERIHFRTRVLRIPLVSRSLPDAIRPYAGSTWCALSSEAVRYAVEFTERNPNVVRFFRHVLIPDELYFPTLLMNSPLAQRVANERTHYIEWPGGSHPVTLGTEHFARLAESGKPFARKFDDENDPLILDLIDRELLGVDQTDKALRR